jgi:hypothetical protein
MNCDRQRQMGLEIAHKNVYDVLFFGHDYGDSRFLLIIQDGKVWMHTISQGG